LTVPQATPETGATTVGDGSASAEARANAELGREVSTLIQGFGAASPAAVPRGAGRITVAAKAGRAREMGSATAQ
jgi:hypothetical protein